MVEEDDRASYPQRPGLRAAYRRSPLGAQAQEWVAARPYLPGDRAGRALDALQSEHAALAVRVRARAQRGAVVAAGAAGPRAAERRRADADDGPHRGHARRPVH